MAVTYYVKYYPTNYDAYPNDRQHSDFLSNGTAYVYNNLYNIASDTLVYVIPSDINMVPSFTNYNTSYTVPQSAHFLADSSTGVLRQNNTYFMNYGVTRYPGQQPRIWNANTNNWSPLTIATFRDNCITFIQNNNWNNWEHINLDLWLFQDSSQDSYDGSVYMHVPVFYEGNNPAADYTVTI